MGGTFSTLLPQRQTPANNFQFHLSIFIDCNCSLLIENCYLKIFKLSRISPSKSFKIKSFKPFKHLGHAYMFMLKCLHESLCLKFKTHKNVQENPENKTGKINCQKHGPGPF